MSAFARLKISRWRQFEEIDLDLSKRITVLTGANGAGKTTLLTTLTQHFGWNLAFVSTPRIMGRRTSSIWSDIYEDKLISDDDINHNEQVQVGEVHYESSRICKLITSRIVSANYSLQYAGLEPVRGLFVPSHRPQAVHSPVQNIPTNPITTQQQYEQYQSLLMQTFGSGNIRNPGTIQKQSIISLAVFGEGNNSVAPNIEYQMTFSRLENALRIMLPKNLKFQRIEIRSGDVVLVTGTGDFSIDSMSGGVNSLFGLAWQLTMFASLPDPMTIIIDEPENHLHPSMQRTLLPNLSQAFPDSKIIVATHSPFIITSFPEAAVYGLAYNDSGKVFSQYLSGTELAGTPNQVLRDILEVDSNVPVWVEEKIKAIFDDPSLIHDQAERGRRIMSELSRLGLADALGEYNP
ncbi:AAA family ATPase [Sphingobium bisphenolivorans]|uniref:AAA family ATPase n=1 Tax=Sphingobium bisphenolivorans TaxID=1335760 RepID=UPI0003AB1DFB|nr:AAA family ATPase [Sphingobium bisphenolivorans]